MSYKLSLCCLVLFPVFTASASAQEEEKPHLQLRSLHYLGTGCSMGPNGNPVEVTIEGGTLKLRLPEMVAEMGPQIPFVNNRKNCSVVMDLFVPGGWSYALQSYQLRGYTSLSAGAKAEVILTNYFEGNAASARFTSSWVGPREEDYAVQDAIPISSQLWSPCGLNRRLTVNLQVRMREGPGLVSLDSWDLSEFGLAFRRCPGV